MIWEIYKNGAVAKDGRLKVGDQIRECNGIAINKDMAYERVCLSIKLRVAKVSIVQKKKVLYLIDI